MKSKVERDGNDLRVSAERETPLEQIKRNDNDNVMYVGAKVMVSKNAAGQPEINVTVMNAVFPDMANGVGWAQHENRNTPDTSPVRYAALKVELTEIGTLVLVPLSGIALFGTLPK